MAATIPRASGTDAMKEWSVAVEFVATAPTGQDALANAATEMLGTEQLQRHHPGAVSVRKGRLGFHLWVEALDLEIAIRVAVAAVLEAASEADAEIKLELAQAGVTSWADFEKGLELSNSPQLVGVGEIAPILGVSKQRVSELASTPGFPEPLARLKSGPVWDSRAIGNFVKEWRRTPGRPPGMVIKRDAHG